MEKLDPAQQVKRVGKYLHKHIYSSYKIKYSGNTCDIYFTVLYEVPQPKDPRYVRLDDSLNEMKVNINVTTYQKKLRVNVIEISPNERTLGFDIYKPEDLVDLPKASKAILNRVEQRISKAYDDYEFIF